MSVCLATKGIMCDSGGMTTKGIIFIPFERSIIPVVEVADPKIPIHISNLTQGDQVRIVTHGDKKFVPKITAKGDRVLQQEENSKRFRGYEVNTLVGRVVSNSPQTGLMSLVVIIDPKKPTYKVAIPYDFISIIQRIIPADPVESGTAGHPGSTALGTNLTSGRLLTPMYNLVRVKF